MKKNAVICAIDVYDFDQDVIDLAAEFARQFGVDLDILYVSLFPDPSNASWPGYLGSPGTFIQDNQQLRKIGTQVEDVDVHHHHLAGLPADKIINFVQRNEPRLLVVGTHGRRGISRLLGSVATKVLRKAQCPVMVLRQRQNSGQMACFSSS